MNSFSSVSGAPIALPLDAAAGSTAAQSDYYARALALWPRVDRSRLARVRHDPARVAVLISHRTNLSLGAILELLGVPIVALGSAERDH